jgi:hypothetical protein
MCHLKISLEGLERERSARRLDDSLWLWSRIISETVPLITSSVARVLPSRRACYFEAAAGSSLEAEE